MGFGRTAEGVNVVREKEVLVMFVTADGEDLARKFFRRAQNIIKCKGRKKGNKGKYKNYR